MKYRTTIEIVTDAASKTEASEIVGEYLSGNIVSGVEMRCHTRPASNMKKGIAAALTLCVFMVVAGVLSVSQLKHSQSFIRNSPGMSAVQPPLKTGVESEKDSKFQDEWQKRQTDEALRIIKQ